jgi:arsenate reductase
LFTIYHNNRCSKSREALAFLQQKGLPIQVVNYLETPPTVAELRDILAKLGYSARQLLRTKEPEFLEMGLDNSRLTEAELISAMCQCPKLIERPIVVASDKAIVARPADLLKDFC